MCASWAWQVVTRTVRTTRTVTSTTAGAAPVVSKSSYDSLMAGGGGGASAGAHATKHTVVRTTRRRRGGAASESESRGHAGRRRGADGGASSGALPNAYRDSHLASKERQNSRNNFHTAPPVRVGGTGSHAASHKGASGPRWKPAGASASGGDVPGYVKEMRQHGIHGREPAGDPAPRFLEGVNYCEVPGCDRESVGWAVRADVYHERAGWRCAAHGGHRECGVAACHAPAEGLVDLLTGQRGARCLAHCGPLPWWYCSVAGCASLSCGYVDAGDEHAAEKGWRCGRHAGWSECGVQGCSRTAQGRTTDGVGDHDSPAPDGGSPLLSGAPDGGDDWWRCGLHGGWRRCQFPYCHNVALARVVASNHKSKSSRARASGDVRPSHDSSHARLGFDDAASSPGSSPMKASVAGANYVDSLVTASTVAGVGSARGAPQWRCRKHGGRRLCDVPRCDAPAEGITDVSSGDAHHAAAGWRCRAHGQWSKCTVPACSRMATALVTAADAHHRRGGWRCQQHGGDVPCSVPRCSLRAHGRVRDGDEFHSSGGWRCGAHGGNRSHADPKFDGEGQCRCCEPAHHRCLNRHGFAVDDAPLPVTVHARSGASTIGTGPGSGASRGVPSLRKHRARRVPDAAAVSPVRGAGGAPMVSGAAADATTEVAFGRGARPSARQSHPRASPIRMSRALEAATVARDSRDASAEAAIRESVRGDVQYPTSHRSGGGGGQGGFGCDGEEEALTQRNRLGGAGAPSFRSRPSGGGTHRSRATVNSYGRHDEPAAAKFMASPGQARHHVRVSNVRR